MSVNAYNLIILVGAVHGVLLSVLLFFSSRNTRLGNALLATLLLLFTLPVLRVVLNDLGFFVSYSFWPLSIELLYGLGPALYLYARAVTESKRGLTRLDCLHFLPVALELIYYLSPFYDEQLPRFFGPPVGGSHLFWMAQQAGAVVSILLYLALTNKLLWDYSRWVRDNYSDTRKRALKWLRTPVMLYSVFFLLWLGLRLIDVTRFDDSLPIQPYYPLLIFLSFSTYWIGTRGYLQTHVETASFEPRRQKVEEKSTEGALLDKVHDDLKLLMSRDQLYLDSDLSLARLAEQLSVNPRLLSRTINTKAEMSFYDFVNQYRVEEFKRRVVSQQSYRTLLDLAYDCGFGSKATFNHVFKKATGLTPSQFRRRFKAKSEPE